MQSKLFVKKWETEIHNMALLSQIYNSISTVTLQNFNCICPVSGDLCKMLQEYPLLSEFYYIDDRAPDTTFVEIPGSQQKINQQT